MVLEEVLPGGMIRGCESLAASLCLWWSGVVSMLRPSSATAWDWRLPDARARPPWDPKLLNIRWSDSIRERILEDGNLGGC
ncbi:MAG: hypothetical protein RIR70_1638 [Pseudomonadota bacterium]|jgi:hypothetical protein